MFVPNVGNGSFGQLQFEGPVLALPAATGETVTLYVGQVGTTWNCPGEGGPTSEPAGTVLPAECRSYANYEQRAVLDFEVGPTPAGLAAEVDDQLPDRSRPVWRAIELRAETPGVFEVPVRYWFDDGTTFEDSIAVRFVAPKRLELLRERRRGPGTSLLTFPGVAHAWCARLVGEIDGLEVALLAAPQRFSFAASDSGLVLERFPVGNATDWTRPSLYVNLPIPAETTAAQCVWLKPNRPGPGKFGVNWLDQNVEVELELADPEQVTSLEIRELLPPPSPVTEDWVPLDAPYFLPEEERALERIELERGSPARVFAVVGRLADGRLALGGRGLLTAGPHGVIDLVTGSESCATPLGCWSFGFELNGPGDAELSASLPNADEFVMAVTVSDVGGGS